MEKACKQCSASFQVTDDDITFYKKVSPIFKGKQYPIPTPTLCPDCRAQRRLSFRNERSLYRRTCDKSGQEVISFYSPEKTYTVYSPEQWRADTWDGTEFGREFNASQPFFDQFDELLTVTPKLALMILQAENADYCPFSIRFKNSYMSVSGLESENIYYGYFTNHCRDSVDCSVLNYGELCYDCTSCEHAYHCIKCFNCSNIADCLFCYDCRQCKNCIGCVSLRNKEYCILNEQYSKEEYEKKAQDLYDHLGFAFTSFSKKVEAMRQSQPHLFAEIQQSDGSTGHFLHQTKQALNCFDCTDIEDCKYCANILHVNDAMDCHYLPGGELLYEVVSTNGGSRQAFCFACWDSDQLMYCHECIQCKDCFGCSGLKSKQYCILNKQYSKDEYEELVPKLIEHMKKNGEWGEFFPMSLSPFCYNETIAQDYFPLTEKAALKQDLQWYNPPHQQQVSPTITDLPKSITDTPDSICDEVLKCSITGQPYKITKQELNFYRTMKIPIPTKCPEQRSRERRLLRNPRTLWQRTCDKCSKDIQTTYAPDRPEAIYCEKCYLDEVY